ncbi:Protein-disulfide isomerase [Micrococcales bacterium KH10]|nr:Protein-disulfide isomerase [Micrococcales bacterium KH10]
MAANTQQSKSDRREAARQQAAALKQAQLKKEARVRRITLLSIIVGILVIGALIFTIVTQGNNKGNVDPEAAGPATATAVNNGIPYSADGVAGTENEGAVTVEIVSDYLCPWCARFEQTNLSTIEEFRDSGDITVITHPVAILNRGNLNGYSVRAAAAYAYVAQEAPEQAWAFNNLLFASQPTESGSGLTDDQLVELAKQAGVPDDVAAASVNETFRDWIVNHTEAISSMETARDDQGNFSTPTILINGERYAGSPVEAEEFRTAIEEAIAAG